MPNGCCMSCADGGGHDLDCYWYWPCGCRKIREKPGDPAIVHEHRFVERFAAKKGVPND